MNHSIQELPIDWIHYILEGLECEREWKGRQKRKRNQTENNLFLNSRTEYLCKAANKKNAQIISSEKSEKVILTLFLAADIQFNQNSAISTILQVTVNIDLCADQCVCSAAGQKQLALTSDGNWRQEEGWDTATAAAKWAAGVLWGEGEMTWPIRQSTVEALNGLFLNQRRLYMPSLTHILKQVSNTDWPEILISWKKNLPSVRPVNFLIWSPTSSWNVSEAKILNIYYILKTKFRFNDKSISQISIILQSASYAC